MTQPPLAIRHALIADAQTIAELHVRSWQWAYQGLIPDEYLAEMVETLPERIEKRREQLVHLPQQTRWWVAEQIGQLAGFAMTGPSRDPGASPATAEVFAIYLSREAAGQGIGRALFTHAVADLRQRGYEQATLWVLASNQRARRFYEAAGWSPDGASKSEERPGATLHEVRYHIALR